VARVKIALVQINAMVGDLAGNAARIADAVRRAHAHGAALAVTSELALLGYLPRDLLLRRSFIDEARRTLETLAQTVAAGPAVLVGVAEANDGVGRPLFNSAALLRHGRVQQSFYKTLLPTYDVFDEDRYFEPARGPQLLDLDGTRIGVSICEDVWNDRTFWERRRYHTDPIEDLARAGASVIVNLSASPFTAGKQRLREQMLGNLARTHRTPIVYVNQTGGNDDLVFDGRSAAYDATGQLVARARAFEEDVVVFDLAASTGTIAPDDAAPESELWRALVCGTRDYVRKCGFRGALLGLSGGIDSAVTAAIAVEALGPDQVLGVLMPSPHSSRGSVDDSIALAQALAVRTITLPIGDLMNGYDDVLAKPFAGLPRDTTEENIQARIRGTLLMALSNKHGYLLLTTGNKSELAVGYCTLYGDMNGGLAVIADVPKTMVYRLARWWNRERPAMAIPGPIITKAPSAELRPDQKDQDSLPEYDVLDAILQRFVERHQTPAEIVAQGFDAGTVARVVTLVRGAEFKRRQAAPGIKVTDRAFGTGWRMPIARHAAGDGVDAIRVTARDRTSTVKG
jgi:NAD+ synthase/NAD+ synthase (glutamine-hydrolysing)